MAWPAALTSDEQETVLQFVASCRAFAADLGQLNVLGAAIAAGWAGGISTLVNSLDPADLIPNTSGLAGAQPLGKADVANIAGYGTTISNPTNPSQGTGGYNSAFIEALLVKAAGINASIGK